MLNMSLKTLIILGITFALFMNNLSAQNMTTIKSNIPDYDTATFGSGCFWCSEAIFSLADGVVSVLPGYSGGKEPNPTYELVCTGSTEYAEVVQITFDPDKVSYRELLEIFWKTHDPTTPNRQGADVGPQYRSVIFYHNNHQKEEALFYKNELGKAGIWKKPIVTEISSFRNFYPAEEHHINFYKNNPANAYCNFVITPKMEKFKNVFADQLAK